MTPVDAPAAGYRHPAYAASLAEFGTPRHLRHCDGWILERPIAGGAARDAMGCYPLFACGDWSLLHLDLEEIGQELVSLALVADPFGGHTPEDLNRCFPDRLVRFKEHFVTDLGRAPKTFVAEHHQRNARKALQAVAVEHHPEPAALADAWRGLYANLTERHGISGIAAFTPLSLERQLQVPGLDLFSASADGEVVGMILWYRHGDAAYYHLGAYCERGYQLRASFALFRTALDYFSGIGTRWLDLGAGAGLGTDEADGLSRFKRGWATGTCPAFFCGRIFDRGRYEALTAGQSVVASDYFPAYRRGEFR